MQLYAEATSTSAVVGWTGTDHEWTPAQSQLEVEDPIIKVQETELSQ